MQCEFISENTVEHYIENDKTAIIALFNKLYNWQSRKVIVHTSIMIMHYTN